MRKLLALLLLCPLLAHSSAFFIRGSSVGTTPPTPCAAGMPHAGSCTAIAATVANNPLCTTLTQFIAGFGNASGLLYSVTGGTAYLAGNHTGITCPGSGPSGCPASNNVFSFAVPVNWASSTKWITIAYAVQLAGGWSSVPAPQLPFLNFTSGYTSMGDGGTACSNLGTPWTVAQCLLRNNAGVPYTTQTAANIGSFFYDSAHLENWAAQYGSSINTQGAPLLKNNALSQAIWAQLGMTGTAQTSFYTNPLLSGALYGPASDYITFLTKMAAGTIKVGTNPYTNSACTEGGGAYTVGPTGTASVFTCTAIVGQSPLSPDHDYYLGPWDEADPLVNGDFAISSAGAYGMYPYLETNGTNWGIIARSAQPGYYGGANGQQPGTFNGQQGAATLRCGRLLRRANDTGVQQTGSIPM